MKYALLLAFAALGVAGCSAAAKRSDTSTIDGSVSSASFSSTPVAVQAIDEHGRLVRSDVAKDGTFQLQLGRGHRWALEVVLASGTEPIVFPRANNNVDATFRVVGGGARVSLGSVRHVGAADAWSVTSTAVTCDDSSDGNFEGDGQCENGVCSSAPDGVEAADTSKEASVAEHEAPADVGGCDGGGNNED